MNSGRHEQIRGGKFPVNTLEPDMFYKTKIYNGKEISIWYRLMVTFNSESTKAKNQNTQRLHVLRVFHLIYIVCMKILIVLIFSVLILIVMK